MASISSPVYTLDSRRKVTWSAAQEGSLAEFPLEINEETPEEYTYRTYLQFLWLPESIMPLHLLVPTLRRIKASSSSDTHPLHTLLDEIIFTVPTVTKKYRTELLRILMNGGGAGEMEEGMMWFALTHERADNTEPWLDVPWRDRWLERLERREVQIQILLYFLKLSLPSPPVKAKGKRRRSSSSEITTEEYLEAFMDTLSMWQLLNTVQSSNAERNDERDWMQVFCEDIVEPEFKSSLPDLCRLLRSKVFPHSPFSDDESNASTTRASSPTDDTQPVPRAPSTSGTRRQSSKASSKPPDARALDRARSRSLSISLAQEREQSAANANKRRMGTREISMSRVFKPKLKSATSQLSEKQPQGSTQSQASQSQAKYGVTLVEETPAKPARDRTASFSQTQSQASASMSRSLFGRNQSTASAVTDNDDAWQIQSSPEIMLLASPGKEADDEDVDMVPVTPSKPRRTYGKSKRGKR
ncbi:hypothetical protein DFP72DRAFT_136106 [Ephemerocybe angulata]|uniref:DNA replication regulator Sld3 C-terminal domain-containing protein n=1 Tax=Ephemerocybe angulata TaxID=980116 RepID=A0A8H6I5Z5_9AGAR|nr:hypothetical protein DFP72DRAFT_136106 [Tulosesus angulatus]